MQTEEVTAAVEITGGPYGARAKGEKFHVPAGDVAKLEKDGFVTRGAAKVAGGDKA